MKKYNLSFTLFILLGLITATLDTYAQKQILVRRPANAVVVPKLPERKIIYVKQAIPYGRNLIVKAIPRTRKMLVYNDVTFYYHKGVFYKAHPKGYIAVTPFIY